MPRNIMLLKTQVYPNMLCVVNRYTSNELRLKGNSGLGHYYYSALSA